MAVELHWFETEMKPNIYVFGIRENDSIEELGLLAACFRVLTHCRSETKNQPS